MRIDNFELEIWDAARLIRDARDKLGEDIESMSRGVKDAGMEEQTQQLFAFLNEARAKAGDQVGRIRGWLVGVRQGEDIYQRGTHVFC